MGKLTQSGVEIHLVKKMDINYEQKLINFENK